MSIALQTEAWMQAILSLAQHYRLQVSAESVRSVSLWSKGAADDATLRQLARQAGLSLHFEAVGKRGAGKGFGQDRLPLVVELADGSVHVVLSLLADGRYRSINAAEPEVDAALDAQELARHTQRIARLRPLIDVADARVDDYIKPYRPHWFWRIALRDWRRYSDVMLASLAANVLALAGIVFSMQVYDRVVPAQSIPTLWVLFSGVLVAICFEFCFRMLRVYISDRVGKRADVALSDVVFGRALRTRSDARPPSTGVFIAQIRELEQVRELLTSTTIGAVADLPFFVLFIGVLYAMAGDVAFVALAAMPLIVIPGLLLQIPLTKLSRQGMRESALRSAVLIETVQGMDDIKLMGAEPRFQSQWNHANTVSADISMKQRFYTGLLTTWTQEVQGLVYAIVLLVGSVLVMSGDITTGVLVGASILSSRMIAPLAQLSGVFARWQQARVALDGIDSLMSRPLDYPEDQRLTSRAVWRGSYSLSGVRFQYTQEQSAPTLSIDRLQIQAGERVAVLGRMGSGKSTLMQMLCGLLPPQAGTVMLDGVPLTQIDPADVRRDMGVLPQSAQLFHGTVRDNLLMGAPRADDAAVLEALKLAGGAGLLASSPKGLDSPITEGGHGLSGGQRQTLLLARALLRDPSIVLLDEPTASYDELSERQAIAALEPWMQGRTLIVATHRPALLALVSRIIVIDGGRVVMDGAKDKVLEALRG